MYAGDWVVVDCSVVDRAVISRSVEEGVRSSGDAPGSLAVPRRSVQPAASVQRPTAPKRTDRLVIFIVTDSSTLVNVLSHLKQSFHIISEQLEQMP